MTRFRVAFDIDGVFADLSTAYGEVERRLRAKANEDGASVPAESGAEAVWREISRIDGFWLGLEALESTAVDDLHRTAERLSWEVFFVTRRPETSGETSQRQTQRWLVAQGFELPSVLVVNGSRGRVADALALDALVDDLPSHCVDVKSESKAKPILMLRQGDDAVSRKARKLGIEVVTSMRECLGLLEGMSRRRGSSLVSRLARRVGLSS